MQSDEDIGKVAQATPVVVAKALELFMTSLIQESCNQARNRNAKRVSPAHLKQAVKSIEHFDFLIEMVEKYPDPVGASADPSNPQNTIAPSTSNTSNTSVGASNASLLPSESNEDSSDSNYNQQDDASVEYQPQDDNSGHSDTKTRTRTRTRS